MKILQVFILLILFMKPVFAITSEDTGIKEDLNIEDYIKDFVDIPEGGIDWRLFGSTKEIEIKEVTEEGYDNRYIKPEFQPELKSLDGKEIKIKGYMFPLGSEEKQALFLFGPFPLSCPYHYHVGPSLVIEVNAEKKPIEFNYDPITVIGTLELVEEQNDYDLFYRIENARQEK